MPEQLTDPVLIAFNLGALGLSVGTCVYLLAIRRRGPWLLFEPRRPVPWNFVGALPALAIVLLTLSVALNKADGPAAEAVDNRIESFHLAGVILQEVFIVSCCLVLAVAGFKATRSDLGLPSSLSVLMRDVGIGLVAGISMIAPVYLIMLLLIGPDAESGHPLVKMLESGQPDLAVMLLATFMAVVVAPVCEEVTFRLLLQGWLERRELLAVWRRDMLAPNEADTITIAEGHSLPADGILQPAHEALECDGSEARAVTQIDPRDFFFVSAEGPVFGWPSIAISSLLFALAHFGYGPDPIPLFFLALVLGYLYFRTHRIVPSIVAHALFNAFAMGQLWWMVFGTEAK